MEVIIRNIMIPEGKLFPHPDNPRKDLGDLTELKDSIRMNGILQNLTVIERDADAGEYTVIIGHRRLAAARLAGFSPLPCMVVEMDEKEQLCTMLAENMQRSDLTIYEQAQGFQMMLDLGESIESIAKQSGFSESTVRRRIKLAELDKAKFKKAVDRGATLFDFMQLDKIESPKLRDKVLGFIGTKDFNQKLQTAIDDEKKAKYLAAALEAIKPYAEEVEKIDRGKMQYVRGFTKWHMSSEIVLPEDIQTAKYYYTQRDYGIDLYRDREDEPVDKEVEARKAAEERRQARLDNLIGQLREITVRSYRLRKSFMQEFGAAKKHLSVIAKYTGKCLGVMMQHHYNEIVFNPEIMQDLLNVPADDEDFDLCAFDDVFDKTPEYALAVLSLACLDGSNVGYYGKVWEQGPTGKYGYIIKHRPNESLDLVYEMLCELGYEMSDEETMMQLGDHPLFSVNIDMEEDNETVD